MTTAAIQQGDSLPPTDPLDTDPIGFVVLCVEPREVVCVDPVLGEVYRWYRAHDGIRVDLRQVVIDDGCASSDWAALPITVYEPPPMVADHLRGAE